jgi:hypothetical protein
MRFIRLFSFILFLLIAMAFASPGFAQDTRDATTYSQPRLVRGDASRCQFETVVNGENITLTLLNGAVSQGTKKDKSRCKIEFQATIQPEEGWYAYGIQQALDADTQITQNGGTALITVRNKLGGVKQLYRLEKQRPQMELLKVTLKILHSIRFYLNQNNAQSHLKVLQEK